MPFDLSFDLASAAITLILLLGLAGLCSSGSRLLRPQWFRPAGLAPFQEVTLLRFPMSDNRDRFLIAEVVSAADLGAAPIGYTGTVVSWSQDSVPILGARAFEQRAVLGGGCGPVCHP